MVPTFRELMWVSLCSKRVSHPWKAGSGRVSRSHCPVQGVLEAIEALPGACHCGNQLAHAYVQVYQLCRLAGACIGRAARCVGCAGAAQAASWCVTPRKVGCVTRPPCTTAAKASWRASSRLWAPQALHRLRAQRRAARRRARAGARRRCSRAALPHPWCRSAACGTRRLSRCRRTWSTHGQGVTAARRAAHERGAAACIGGGSGRNRRRRQPRLRARTLVARQSSGSTRP